MSNSMIQKTPTGTGSFQSNSSQKNGKNMHSTSRHPKGKSKYAKKSRSKSKKPVAAKPAGPANNYTSVCCGVPATKPACKAVGKKEALVQGLGSWRCTGCKKVCSVTVKKAEAKPDVRDTEPAGQDIRQADSNQPL